MRHVAILGGDKGYGAAIAESFRSCGDRVTLIDEAAHRVEWSGLPQLDVLVLASLHVHRAPFLELSEAAFDRSIEINVRAAFLAAQDGARQMISHGRGGCILFLSSTGATVATPGLESYCASKGAIAALARAAAVALAPHGIRVNAIAPGTIATAATRDRLHAGASAMAQALSRTPLGRIGAPEELGRVAVFLASKDAAYIAGQSILVDGGRVALEGLVNQDFA